MWESLSNAVRRAGAAIGSQARIDWVAQGRNLKRLGKRTGTQWMIDKGREWQYGHLSPEELLKQHPSAFLRTYAIESQLESPDAPRTRLRASVNRNFQLRVAPDGAPLRQFGPIQEVASGIRRAPLGFVNLVFSEQAAAHGTPQLGQTFHAAFLPMRQVTQDNFNTLAVAGNRRQRFEARLNQNVPGYQRGRITDNQLAHAGETVTLTTQLSGCSIVKRYGTMLHLRPKNDGLAMQNSLSPEHTYGRRDYPQPHQAFVMMRRKPDGRTKLYFQRQDWVTGTLHSGSRYLPR
jgi:hypothetical protein